MDPGFFTRAVRPIQCKCPTRRRSVQRTRVATKMARWAATTEPVAVVTRAGGGGGTGLGVPAREAAKLAPGDTGLLQVNQSGRARCLGWVGSPQWPAIWNTRRYCG